MRVILTRPVDNLGEKDQVCEVSAGYARNYLFPRGLAQPARPSDIERAVRQQQRQAKRTAQTEAKINETIENLKKIQVNISAKANPAGRLFGSVDEQAIRLSLEKEHHLKLPDSAKFDDAPIRQLGQSTRRWRWSGGRTFDLTVNVTSISDA